MSSAFDPLQCRRDKALDPAVTAVLIVDAQQSEVTERHRIQHPEYWQALHERALPAMRRLIDGARAAGCEIIYTVIEALTRDGRDRSLDHKLSGIHVPPDAPEGDIIAPLWPRPGEIVLPKTSSGVFNSTNLDYLLRNLGIRFVIVAGIVTDQCVDMAVRDGADRGYLVTCVTDACATYSAARHAAALAAFGGYCWSADAATVLGRLDRLAPREIA